MKRAVSLAKTPYHLARQYLQRRIDPAYRPGFAEGADKERARALAETMRRDGIVLLPSYFHGAQLERLAAAFERITAGKVNKHTPDSLHAPDLFPGEAGLLQAALDAFLLEVIGNYFHRRFGLAFAAATRLLPTSAHRGGSYQWHHDARGKQVNLMVLLSTVTPGGQGMSYLRGSHLSYYGHYRGIVDTRFNDRVDADPSSRQRVSFVTGPAGTVALFDSNGLHSGNRNAQEGRDTLHFNFASRRHFKKVRVRRADLLALAPAQRAVMTLNPNLEQVD